MSLAHEALLRQWGLLTGWLEEDLGALTTLEGAKRAASDWAANGRDSAWLSHRSGRLEEAEKQSAREAFKDFFTSEERAYLAACRAIENAEARRRRRTSRIITFVSLAAAFVLLITAGLAGVKWIEANWQADAALKSKTLAEANQSTAFAALGEVKLATDPSDVIKLALAAWPRDHGSNIGKSRFTFDLLKRAIPAQFERRILTGHDDSPGIPELSPDQSSVLTYGGSSARIWDVSTGEAKLALDPNSGPLSDAHYSPDGVKAVTAGYDGLARIWDTKSGREILRLRGHEKRLNSAQFAPDGGRV